ncbi:MAG: hypothetical protein JKY52_00005, partial [Flavobacteriales bacterium]|nr:hypothetical protein [Flavobacteriales bacterium]
MTNCHNAQATFITGLIPIIACGVYTWELIAIPPCDWSRRLNGDLTPPEINIEELRAEHAQKSRGFTLYYLIAGTFLVLAAAFLMKRI